MKRKNGKLGEKRRLVSIDRNFKCLDPLNDETKREKKSGLSPVLGLISLDIGSGLDKKSTRQGFRSDHVCLL